MCKYKFQLTFQLQKSVLLSGLPILSILGTIYIFKEWQEYQKRREINHKLKLKQEKVRANKDSFWNKYEQITAKQSVIAGLDFDQLKDKLQAIKQSFLIKRRICSI